VSANGITVVALDAHTRANNLAMLLPGAKLRVEWPVAKDPAAIRFLLLTAPARWEENTRRH
jgi:hypothetical protein